MLPDIFWFLELALRVTARALCSHGAWGLSGTGGCSESLGTEWVEGGEPRGWAVQAVGASRQAKQGEMPFLSQARAGCSFMRRARCCPPTTYFSFHPTSGVPQGCNQLGLQGPLRTHLVWAPLWAPNSLSLLPSEVSPPPVTAL